MINIYCDESCHLENDNSDVMVLGGMTCEDYEKSKIFNDIRNIKIKNELSSWYEIKWTKVSSSKIDFYKELIDYFFEHNLSFRAIVAKSKNKLNHEKYNRGSFDVWYYKMYFLLLDAMINPLNEYRIFIDIKDTRGGPKVIKLHEVLCNNRYDFKHDVIKDIKQINSKESEILQIVDLFIGALSYFHRGLCKTSNAKTELVNYLINKYEVNLEKITDRNENKFNIFIWQPRR